MRYLRRAEDEVHRELALWALAGTGGPAVAGPASAGRRHRTAGGLPRACPSRLTGQVASGW